MLSPFSIRQVIIGTMAAVTVVAVGCIVALLITTGSLRDNTQLQARRLLADEAIADRIAFHVQHQIAAAQRFMATGDAEHLEDFRAEGLEVYDQLRLYLFRPLDPGERLLVEQIRERHQAIEVEAQRVFGARTDRVSVADMPGVRELQQDLRSFLELRRERTQAMIDDQERLWKWLYIACGVLAAAFAAAMAVAAMFLRRRLFDPLRALSRAARRVGSGDFHARVSFAGDDELASVAQSFNRMAERLDHARRATQDAEHRFRDLVERVPVGMYRTTPEGRLIDVNPALVELLGYPSAEALLGSNAADGYVDASERTHWLTLLDETDDVVEVDRQHRRRDGTLLWLRDTARAVRSDSGVVQYYEGVLQDVTERVHAEEALRRSEAWFRSLIENATDGVIILSAQGLVTYQSPAVERILGYPPDEMMGRSPFDLVHPDEYQDVMAAFAEVQTAEGHGKSIEFRCRHADGSWRMLHALGSNLLNDPAVGGIVVNMIDSTVHRSLEEQLHHSQRLEAVGRLAGGIAHDFNNLLTAIRGYTDLLGDKLDDDARAHADVVEIRRAVERAARLTRQLLAFSRRQVVRPRATELGGVIVELEQMLRRLITEEIQLHTRVARDAWVFADPGQLEQVVVNLIVNARDAAPRDGIRVAVDHVQVPHDDFATPGVEPGAYVRLTVADDGTGIDPEILPHIFEPFFTTKELGKGTGLGLATVYGIVKDAGGTIFMDSSPGVGTTVSVYLPRVERPEHDVLSLEPRVAEPEQGTELVLLVEDEPAVRSLGERVLMRQGYHVLTAANGVEALRLVASMHGQIDLLVTDVVMPEMGGVELAAQMVAMRPDLPILFISGYSADTVPTTDVNGRQLHFLEKPFSPARFAEFVRQVLDAVKQPA